MGGAQSGGGPGQGGGGGGAGGGGGGAASLTLALLLAEDGCYVLQRHPDHIHQLTHLHLDTAMAWCGGRTVRGRGLQYHLCNTEPDLGWAAGTLLALQPTVRGRPAAECGRAAASTGSTHLPGQEELSKDLAQRAALEEREGTQRLYHRPLRLPYTLQLPAAALWAGGGGGGGVAVVEGGSSSSAPPLWSSESRLHSATDDAALLLEGVWHGVWHGAWLVVSQTHA